MERIGGMQVHAQWFGYLMTNPPKRHFMRLARANVQDTQFKRQGRMKFQFEHQHYKAILFSSPED